MSLAVRSASAEMPQVDHCVGQGLERVVQRADALESKQQSAKLVFPSEHPFDGAKPLLENAPVEQALAAALGLLAASTILGNVWNQATVEDSLAIGLAVVGPVCL